MTGIRKSYSGNATATTLAGAITNSSTTIPVTAIVGFPDTTVGPFVIVVDRGNSSEEKILIQSYSGTNMIVETRGYDGTSAQAHGIGANVVHTLDAVTIDQANDIVNAVGSVVPTTSAIGDSASEGTSEIPAAADHLHGRESFGSGATTSSAVGDNTSDGSSASVARADHKHGREAFGTSASASALGDAEAPGTATTPSRSDHRHGRESLSSSTPSAPAVSGSAGTATAAPHADHVHPFGQSLEVWGVGAVFAGSSSTAGKKIQFGIASGTTDSSGRITITFPNAFPTACNVVLFTDITSTTSNQGVHIEISNLPTASQFTALVIANAAPVVGSVEFAYVAFGE